jgi:hypothetical protein
VPIVVNAGTPKELTLYEKLAVTGLTGYDLLVGTRAAYPSELSVDRWAEHAIYRVDWSGAGAVVGRLPMRLRQTRDGKGRGRTAGAALACCLTN